jgi:hypothetical protein
MAPTPPEGNEIGSARQAAAKVFEIIAALAAAFPLLAGGAIWALLCAGYLPD